MFIKIKVFKPEKYFFCSIFMTHAAAYATN